MAQADVISKGSAQGYGPPGNRLRADEKTERKTDLLFRHRVRQMGPTRIWSATTSTTSAGESGLDRGTGPETGHPHQWRTWPGMYAPSESWVPCFSSDRRQGQYIDISMMDGIVYVAFPGQFALGLGKPPGGHAASGRFPVTAF
jgi:hypothetical protein